MSGGSGGGSGGTMGYVMDGLKTLGGAAATFMGAPEIGVPLMMGGVGGAMGQAGGGGPLGTAGQGIAGAGQIAGLASGAPGSPGTAATPSELQALMAANPGMTAAQAGGATNVGVQPGAPDVGGQGILSQGSSMLSQLGPVAGQVLGAINKPGASKPGAPGAIRPTTAPAPAPAAPTPQSSVVSPMSQFAAYRQFLQAQM